MQDENTFAAIHEVVPAKDKRTRAQSIAGRMSMGLVRFPKFAPWWEQAESELLAFDTGTHDDFVDALSHVGMGLDYVASSERPKPAWDAEAGTWNKLQKMDAQSKAERERKKNLAGWV